MTTEINYFREIIKPRISRKDKLYECVLKLSTYLIGLRFMFQLQTNYDGYIKCLKLLQIISLKKETSYISLLIELHLLKGFVTRI